LPYVFGLDGLSYLARAAFQQSTAYKAASGFHHQASPIQIRYAGSVETIGLFTRHEQRFRCR
jgi:hypothetical protein